ncbi:MAG TPA: FAD binding domain-containing protein [Burkholderiales bacterium]|nr:FAD binding domain-containing protein [Burkholderiales bacterium]
MYLRPTDLTEALAALKAAPLEVLAGGTDFYPARVGRPIGGDILDITALSALRGVREQAAGWRIGALTTWSDLVAAPLPPVFDGLRSAARDVGGVQIQNAGTVAGNICNASPAADGVPALLALGAEVELAALDAVRRLPLREFIAGSRRTLRRPDELVTAVLIPAWGSDARSVFLKLGARRYLVISIVMVAACVEAGPDGAVARATVAVGACSEVAQRLTKLEAKLLGRPLAPALAGLARPDDLAPLAPISDVRGSAEYRRDAALTLVRRALAELGRE